MRICAVALALLLSGVAEATEVTDHFEWTDPLSNGVSGWEVSAGGSRFIAVTDGGWFLSGEIARTEGKISGVALRAADAIQDHNGFPAAGRRVNDWGDAEGLAQTTDGSLIVGFERWMHVGQFDDTSSVQTVLVGLPDFADYAENRQIEAVAVHANGDIFAWPERPLIGDQFDVFRHDGTRWHISGNITELDGFSIVGADFAANGDLYILERKLVLTQWWQNRIRRVRKLNWAAPEVIWTGGLGDFYNLEGVAVIEGAPLRLLLVGDNNKRPNTPTDIVEITLTQ